MSFIKKGFDSITGKTAAKNASQAQQQATQQSMAEQRRQFDIMQQLMNPYVQAGQQGLSGQQDLLGLNGFNKQLVKDEPLTITREGANVLITVVEITE